MLAVGLKSVASCKWKYLLNERKILTNLPDFLTYNTLFLQKQLLETSMHIKGK